MRQVREQNDPSAAVVAWLPEFVALDADVTIAGSELYRIGAIYGIDVSSGAAIAALDPREGDACLDLCCAPGAKLCMVGDRIGPRG